MVCSSRRPICRRSGKPFRPTISPCVGLSPVPWVRSARFRVSRNPLRCFFPLDSERSKAWRHDHARRFFEALGDLQPAADKVVPLLVGLLDDPHPEVRKAAAISLCDFGPAAWPGIGKLRSLVAEDADGVFVRALGAILSHPLPPEIEDREARRLAKERSLQELVRHNRRYEKAIQFLRETPLQPSDGPKPQSRASSKALYELFRDKSNTEVFICPTQPASQPARMRIRSPGEYGPVRFIRSPASKPAM